MVNPGAFQGKRKEFLLGEKAAYAAAVEGDYAADAVANIQRRFFKRFPIEMPADQEPTQEILDQVNDDEADIDPRLPQEGEMTPEEFAAAMKALEQRKEVIAYRKGQIKCWLVYQHMKDNSVDDPSRDGAYRALLQKLTGIGDSRPRQKTASNVWRRDRRDVIEAEARRRVLPQDKKKLASIRQTVASEMFAALSQEEKDKWDKIAKMEHIFAVDKWESEINGPPSTRPVDRQKCILGLVNFIQPILDGMAAATGWKCSLIAGGPEPASGGRLTIVSAHAGVTSGDIKMNFVQAEKQKYKDGVLPAFASFLRKCYTPDDCRAFALSPNSNIQGMDAAELEKEGSSLDALPELGGTESTVTSISSTRSYLPPIPQRSDEGAAPTPTTAMGSSSATMHAPPMAAPPMAAPPMAAPPTSTPPIATPTSTPTTIGTLPTPPEPPVTTNPPPTPIQPLLESVPVSADPDTCTPTVAPVVSTSPSASGPASVLDSTPMSIDPDASTPIDTQSAHSPFPSPLAPNATMTISSPPPPAVVPPPPKHPTRAMSIPASPPVTPPLSPTRTCSPPLPTDALEPTFGPQEPLPVNGITHNALTYPPPSAHVMSFLSALSLSRSKSFTPASTNPSISMPAISSCTSHRSSSPSSESTTSSGSLESTSTSNSSSSSPATSVASVSDGKDAGPEASDCEEDIAARRTRSHMSMSRSALVQDKATGTSKRRKGEPAVQGDSSVARRSKRQRVGGATGDVTSPPGWFTKVWEGFTSEDLGKKWTNFVELWKAFEEHEGFKDGGKLGSRNRPAIIEEWIAHRHRSTTWRPAIDLRDFESDFKAWWTSLQPEWRVSRGSIKKSQLDGEWGPLRRSGKNGFLSIVAALFYWGINAQESAKSRKAWLTALSDCTSALERL